MTGAETVVVSGDGGFVYVLTREVNDTRRIDVHRRTMGGHTFVETLTDPAFDTGPDEVVTLALSSDDRFLYASSRESRRIARFRRDLGTGRLTPTSAWTEPVDGSGTGLRFPEAVVAVSPTSAAMTAFDQRFVFADGVESGNLNAWDDIATP